MDIAKFHETNDNKLSLLKSFGKLSTGDITCPDALSHNELMQTEGRGPCIYCKKRSNCATWSALDESIYDSFEDALTFTPQRHFKLLIRDHESLIKATKEAFSNCCLIAFTGQYAAHAALTLGLSGSTWLTQSDLNGLNAFGFNDKSDPDKTKIASLLASKIKDSKLVVIEINAAQMSAAASSWTKAIVDQRVSRNAATVIVCKVESMRNVNALVFDYINDYVQVIEFNDRDALRAEGEA